MSITYIDNINITNKIIIYSWLFLIIINITTKIFLPCSKVIVLKSEANNNYAITGIKTAISFNE